VDLSVSGAQNPSVSEFFYSAARGKAGRQSVEKPLPDKTAGLLEFPWARGLIAGSLFSAQYLPGPS